MRPLFLFALALPFPAFADTFELASRIDRVTIYPWGASVTRLVDLTAQAGVHDLIIPDLPQDSDAGSLRVTAPDGMSIGAVNLATGRLPVTGDLTSPQVQAAKDEVERLEDILRTRHADIAAIRLRVAAAEEQVAFLRGLGQGKATEGLAAGGVEDLRALSQMVGAEVLAARLAAHEAEQEAQAAERAQKDQLKDLEKARQALAALQTEGQDKAVLSLAVQVTGEAGQLEVTTFTPNASWQPVYDIRLTSGDAPALDIDRFVTVSQNSGEDWGGIEVILSTARPSEQSAPTPVYPWQRRIEDEAQLQTLRKSVGAGFATSESDMGLMAAPMMEPEAITATAQMEMMGATATYRYGGRVDIRDGVEALRLKLDTLALTPEVRAVATPGRDQSAFAVAEVTNAGGELILPGQAMLFRDGALIGQAWLPLIAGGDTADIGFGPIDGIRLTRTVPERSEGDRGMITKSNRIDEVAILSVENLTGQAWPMRVIDQVPYSEQDDLVISYTASPPVTEADVDGARGVLAWEFDLAAGAKREIRLEHSISWPTGYVLQ